MDIDKIQFGQLSAGKTDKSFEELDVNNDGKINEQDENLATNAEIKNAISQILSSDVDEEPELDDDSNFDIDNLSETADTRHAELGSASQDSEIPKQVRNDVSNNTPALQAQLTTLSLQAQKLQKEQEDLQDELETKQKEQEKIEKEILVKQEEYEILAKEIENSEENDPSKIARAEELGAEIKSLTTDFENLKSEIAKIQGKYQSNSTQFQMLNTQIQSLQSKTTQSVSQTNTVNNVQNVNNVANVSSSKRKHVPMKTQEEYNEIIDNKYAELWEKFGGDREKIAQYTKDNMVDFADIDGDGRITLIDRQIYINYYNSAQKLLSSSSCEWKEKGESYVNGKYSDYANLLRTAVGAGCSKNDLYDLEDLDNLLTLGGYVNFYGFHSQLDIAAVAQTENWEEKLTSVLNNHPPYNTHINAALKDIKANVSAYKDFAEKDPEHAGYAALASAYKENINLYSYEKIEEQVRAEYERNIEFFNSKEGQAQLKSEYNSYLASFKSIGVGKPLSYDEYIGDKSLPWELYKNTTAGKNEIKRRQDMLTSNGIPQVIDVNCDGEINAKDLANFSCDVDLDGDGTVSDDEKSFLESYKTKFTTYLKMNGNTFKGYYNLNTIDDVISDLEVFDDNYHQEKLNTIRTMITTTSQEMLDRYEYLYNTTGGLTLDDCAWINYGPGVGGVFLQGYLDATAGAGAYAYSHLGYQDGTCGGDKFNVEHTLDGVMQCISAATDFMKVENTYLHYVMNADLTKCELEEILSKINSASASVQSQLSEVKAVVEQRLASL